MKKYLIVFIFIYLNADINQSKNYEVPLYIKIPMTELDFYNKDHIQDNYYELNTSKYLKNDSWIEQKGHKIRINVDIFENLFDSDNTSLKYRFSHGDNTIRLQRKW